MRRGDAGTAVDTDRAAGHGAEPGEPGQERFRGGERPVRGQVLRRGRADRARDVASLGVDRLDLTSVPLAGPGIEQDAVTGQSGSVVGREHGQVARVEDDVAPGRLVVAGFQVEAGLSPGLQRAVQDADAVEPGPPQQPPGARRGQAAAVVVDDHGLARTQAPLACGFLQRGQVRQWVPAASRMRKRGQLGVEVDVDRGRDVTGPVVITPAAVAERPPDVEDSGRVRLAEELAQGHGVDEDFGARGLA